MALIVSVITIGYATLVSVMDEKYQPPTGTYNDLSVLDEQKLYLYEQAHKAQLSYDEFLEMKRIAQAESGWRQFNEDGSVLRGVENNNDVGIFQINLKYHLERSSSLGYDVMDWKGNIDYSVYLYKTDGNYHWNWSKERWKEIN